MPAGTVARAEFYKGKTVTYVVATAAGGGHDFYGRLVASAMQTPKTIALLAKTLDIKEATVKATGPLLQVEDQGRKIVFSGPDGQKVESIPSGSRTKITIAGKDAQRGDLKTGMHCEISYKSGGDNEPASMVCK